jgi:hypothetical protein
MCCFDPAAGLAAQGVRVKVLTAGDGCFVRLTALDTGVWHRRCCCAACALAACCARVACVACSE